MHLQAANLDEQATLFAAAGETEHAVAAASVRELAAIALAWDDERFSGARIITDAGMRLTPNLIISLGQMMGIERGKDLP